MTAYSLRRELLIISGILIALIALPIFATIGLINNGVQAASDSLVTVDKVSHRVEVKNAKGEIVTTLDTVTTWPIKGTVTQEFGVPNPPYQTAHSGIDIDGGSGAPITVFMKGTVLKSGSGVLAGCGNHCVIVDHGYGTTSIYAHMSAYSVRNGQVINPGDVIGSEGAEGWANGAHLHFEIQVSGIPVNPRTFMVGNPASKN